jgi:hypothetical protein
MTFSAAWLVPASVTKKHNDRKTIAALLFIPFLLSKRFSPFGSPERPRPSLGYLKPLPFSAPVEEARKASVVWGVTPWFVVPKKEVLTLTSVKKTPLTRTPGALSGAPQCNRGVHLRLYPLTFNPIPSNSNP